MKRFSQAFFLCSLSIMTSFSIANGSEVVEELADELQRLRQMSQRLELALPNQKIAQETTPESVTEFVEDEISQGLAAPVRIGRRIDAQGEDLRPLQKDDLRLESTQLDSLENRTFEKEAFFRGRRERSR